MTPPLEPVKGRFPFLLGATSYVIPADILPNVRFLAPLVDDVELVLFEADETSNLPDRETIDALAEIGRESDLGYTVHLPLDIRLGADGRTRSRSVRKAARVIRLTRPLNPFAYVAHLEREGDGGGPNAARKWPAAMRRSVGELLEVGVPARSLCVETLDYPFRLLDPVLEEFDLSACLDVGHMLLHGRPVDTFIRRYGPRCRVVHLHGLKDGRDHRPLCHLEAARLTGLVRWLTRDGPARVVTLEVFSRRDFEESLKVMKGYLT